MPTADQTLELDGSFALETNVSQHSADLVPTLSGSEGTTSAKTFRVFKDLITDIADRIVKRDGKGATLGSVAGTEIQTIHEYVYVDPSTGAESYHVLGAIDGGSYIYRWNGVTTWTGQSLPITPTGGGRWFFCNAMNRVFAMNGIDQMIVGIQTAPNTLTWKIVGVNQPTAAPTYSLTTNNAPYTTGTVAGTNGGSTINGTVGASWPIAAAPTGFAGGVIVINGMRYDISTVAVSGGTLTGNVTFTSGIAAITGVGTAFLTQLVVGARIRANGTDAIVLSITNDTTATLTVVWPAGNFTGACDTGPSLTLTEGFKEATASGLTYTIYWGIGSWDAIAPQYAYAYYNPTTGHCGLPSPVLQVTELNRELRTITITIPGSADNTTAYNNGFTQIQLFRTPKNAGILVALNEKLTNNNAGTAITYVETATKFADTYLTDLEIPTLTRQPPSGISAMVFHQSRGFGIHKPSGTVRFTPLSVEIDLGVAIESWPALYKRDIPSMPRGILTVGGESSADSLVIQTTRGDYSIDGFDSTTFSPYKLQTRRSGGYLGAATDVDGNLVQFYADKRFMVMGNDIAQKIQNRLDAVKDSLISKVRVHWFSAQSRNYLLLSIPSTSSSTANDYTYVFNLDKGGDVYEWPFGLSAFATVHDASTLALKLFAGDPTGAIYQLLSGATQDVASNFAPTFRTSLLRFPEKLAKITYIKLFVNDPQLTGPAGQERSTLWTGNLFINENTNTGATDGTVIPLIFRQERYTKQSAQGNELIATFSPRLRTIAKVFQVEVTFPSVNAAFWVEKMVIGYRADQEIDQAVGKQS